MKFIAAAAALASLAAARPAPAPELKFEPNQSIKARQFGNTRTELEDGGACPDAIFIYARGSTESGNLGTLGPDIADALEDEFGDDAVWIQGVGDPYDASLAGNFLPDGSTRAGIGEMIRLFELADSSCPDAAIVAGGYSQGAALTAAAIRDVDASIRNKIVGTVLFGYTKNQQNNGQIVNYPSDRLEVFCAIGDLVCTGSLTITAAHLSYGDEAEDEAPDFLIGQLS